MEIYGFYKVLSLLDNKYLYFKRSDKFETPFEGSYPKVNKDIRPLIKNDINLTNKIFSKTDDYIKKIREHTLVNFWHMNEQESAAMWKLYLKSNKGIAIQSTYKRFCESFKDSKQDVFIGMVNYIDYELDYIPEGNTFTPFLI